MTPSKPMMLCGHRANSTCDGKPACVIHAPAPEAYTVSTEPDLAGRQARCICGKLAPSTDSALGRLAFFEFKGEGSLPSLTTCSICKFHWIAHERWSGRLMDSVNSGRYPQGVSEHEFKANGPFEFDSFYCGCRGWD